LTVHSKRYVIIGNGVAGTTAAETLRKQDATCSIHLLTNEPYPLYNRVSLPRFLQGVLTEQKVMIRDFPWHEQRGIGIITETMVTSVNTDERVVVTERGQQLPYDALLIATGGWANPLRVPGAEGTKHIYNFVTLDDTRTIIARLRESRTAVAYGGSFISYELCDGFAVRKLDTTWIMRGPYWLRNALDPEGGDVVDTIAKKFGVEVIHGDEIEAVIPQNGVPSYVKTKKGRHIQADIIGVGLGITLNTQILTNTPVQTRTGVVVNDYLETNVSGVYAAGDVAEFFDATIGSHHTMGTWDNAMAHGRTAGTNMAGCAFFESPFEPSAQCGPPHCLGPVQRSKVWLSPDLISRTWSPTPNFTDRFRLSTSAPTCRRSSSRVTLISSPLKRMGKVRPRRWFMALGLK